MADVQDVLIWAGDSWVSLKAQQAAQEQPQPST